MTYKPTKKDLQGLTEMQKLFIKIVIEMKKRKDNKWNLKTYYKCNQY
jgi:hypothetical protein